MTRTRCIAHRVDALVMASQVRLTPEASRALLSCRDESLGMGRKSVEIAGLDWSVKAGRSEGRYTIERGGVRGIYDESAVDGWNLELVARSTYLAANPLHQSLAELDELAVGWGDVEGRRLRRFDLAADFVGWRLLEVDKQRLVKTRCRTAKVCGFDEHHQGADFDEYVAARRAALLAEHAKARRGELSKRERDMLEKRALRDADRTYRSQAFKITGHVIAPGNPVMLRMYDKLAELAAIQDKHKTEAEQGIWSQEGWTSGEPVTRVEFQLRGPVLDELKARNPQKLPEFSYCAGESILPLSRADLHMLDSMPRAERETAIRGSLMPILEAFGERAVRELVDELNGATYAVGRPIEVAARFADGPKAPAPELVPDPPADTGHPVRAAEPKQPARSSVIRF